MTSAAQPEPRRFAGVPPRAAALALAAALVGGLTAFTHAPALRAQAVWLDDDQYLLENRLVLNPSWAHARRFLTEVLAPSTVEGYYQPLTMISLMLDVAMGAGPQNLYPIHHTNLLLHSVNAALVVVFVFQLFRTAFDAGGRRSSPQAERTSRPGGPADRPGQRTATGWLVAAAAGGLIFGLHPLTVETVAWIAERKTLLATFFALLSLLAYLRFIRTRGWATYLCCMAAFLLALLAKPTVTMLPLVMLVLDGWPLGRLGRRRPVPVQTGPAGAGHPGPTVAGGPKMRKFMPLVEKTPLLALSVLFAIITIVSQRNTAVIHMPRQYPAVTIPVMLSHNITFYACKFVWPAKLVPYYVAPASLGWSDPAVRFGLIGTAVILLALALSWKWTRAAAASWVMWFIAILPTMGIIGFTGVIASDKYMYLPMVGFVVGLAWGVAWLWSYLAAREPPVARAAILGAVAVVALAEARQTRATLAKWSDSQRLFVETLALQPRAGIVHNNYANWLVRRGQRAQAMRHYILATQHSPEFEKGWHNLGALLALEGKYAEAVPFYEVALRIKPDYVDALLDLGNALAEQRQFEAAEEVYRRLMRLRPANAAARHNLALVFALQERWADAIREEREALRLQPGYLEAELQLANALAASGRVDEAIELLRGSAASHPGSERVRLQLADLLLQRGLASEAELHYREAIRLKPDEAVSYNNLASALLTQGRAAEALAATQIAIRLDGEYANAHFNAGTILLQLGRPADAVPELETALRHRRDFAKGEHYLAIALGQLGRLEEAVSHYQEALRLDPGNEQIRTGLQAALARRPATAPSTGTSPSSAAGE